MKVLLANPRGFCAGVDRAIAIVEQALAKFGAPIYVRHEVVHNRFVVDDLKAKGAVFVEGLDEVPRGSTVIFSAHGVSKAVRAEADARGLTVFDATCPLVTKVHSEVAKMRDQGREIVMIGHAGSSRGRGNDGPVRRRHPSRRLGRRCRAPFAFPTRIALAYVTQTTLSVDDAAAIVDALKRRFPASSVPKSDDICYATQNRQDAVKAMAPLADVVIVVGSPNSSNSNRLREVAANRGVPRLHDRSRGRAASGVGRGQDARRRDRRRVGAGNPRAGGSRAARRARRGRGARARRQSSASCSRCRRAHGVATRRRRSRPRAAS